MKRMIVMLGCAALMSLSLSVSNVEARPQYNAAFQKIAKGTGIEEAAGKAKCGICHGKKKTERNEFGKALIKAGLTKDSYTKMKSDKEAFAKHIDEVMKKFLESKEGAKFKENIENDKLPNG